MTYRRTENTLTGLVRAFHRTWMVRLDVGERVHLQAGTGKHTGSELVRPKRYVEPPPDIPQVLRERVRPHRSCSNSNEQSHHSC